MLSVLQAKCINCHGEEVEKAELNLSTQAGVNWRSSSGAIVSAGMPDDSMLLELVHDQIMPPPGEGIPLTASEVEVIRQWIITGAHFQAPDDSSEQEISERRISQIMLLQCEVCHNGRFSEGELDL